MLLTRIFTASLFCIALLFIWSCEDKSSNQDIYAQVDQIVPPISLSALPQDWYAGAVFMEIYVRGYKDSDGDGIGDFNGLTEKLDYLADLGVRGLWLMPVADSTDHDHGYMVQNYRALEYQYGTKEDFKRLLMEAHKRGIGIVIDYLVNHSSYQNPIFKASDNGDPRFRDWYVWSPERLDWKGHRDVDSWHKGANGYYYGVFSERMPDFNLRNREVIEFHRRTMRYWLNMGVDGFRFDAVSSLVENGKNAWKSQEDNHKVVRKLRRVISEEYENRFLICEEDEHPVRFAQEDSCGSTFAFGFNYALFDAVKTGDASGLEKYYREYPLRKMGIILANHDSFAGDRPIVQLGGNLFQYRALAATQLLSPGHPFIYYGEEIGIDRSAGGYEGDWGLRPPMSWQAGGGFSSAKKIFREHASNVAQVNVEQQTEDPNSLLNFYKTLIQLRNQYSALRIGETEVLEAGENLVFTRTHLKRTIVVAVNYSGNLSDFNLPNPPRRILYSSANREDLEPTLSIQPYEVLVYSE